MDKDGLQILNVSDKLILDTHMYEIEYTDGHKISLDVNMIVENVFYQVGDEGDIHALFEEKVDN